MIHTECTKIYKPNSIGLYLLLWFYIKPEVKHSVDSYFVPSVTWLKPYTIWYMAFFDTVYDPYD